MTGNDDAARLRNLGVTQEQAQALQAVWNTQALWPLLSETAIGMQHLGHNPIDALDTAKHRLHPVDASTYLRRGFTAHQAFLLINSEQAQANLVGDDSDPDKYEALLDTPMPRDLLTDLLLVSESQSEAEQFLSDIATSPEQPEETIDDESPNIKTFTTISKRVARADVRSDICDCKDRGRF